MTSESPRPGTALDERLQALGRRLGQREASHRQGLDEARAFAEKLRTRVEAALERFHQAAAEAGAPHLHTRLGDIRIDDKHLRAVEFDLSRGRHRAIVTVKTRGQVTFVGPFRSGKNEGPCRSFTLDAAREIEDALGLFLEEFLEQAATP